MAGSRLTDRRRRARGDLRLRRSSSALWNVAHYPPGAGFDAPDHIAYADGLVPHGLLPHGTRASTTRRPATTRSPARSTGSRASPGSAIPTGPGMAVNVLFLLGTVLLVARIARELWPGRRRIALGAAAFVAFLPVTVETAAMFHPETMSLFLCDARALALRPDLRATRATRGRSASRSAPAQLVRAWALVDRVAAVLIALAVGRRWRELAIVVVLAALDPVALVRPPAREVRRPAAVPAARDRRAKPLLERRPLSFYVDPGLPDVITTPYRPHFLNRALPTTYAELWGDYFGVWAWHAARRRAGRRRQPSRAAAASSCCRRSSGCCRRCSPWSAGCAFARRRCAARRGWRSRCCRRSASSVPLLRGRLLLRRLPDGDLLKATYMLTTTAGWALGFGYALDRLRGRLWWLTSRCSRSAPLVELPFLFY